MFQGVQGIGSLSGVYIARHATPVIDPVDKLYHYVYLIDDTEFCEQWTMAIDQRLNYTEVRAPGALIKCYEEKRKGVAYNLYLYHEYMKKRFDWYKLEDEIRYNIEHTPLYMEYAPEVKRIYERMNNLKVFW